MSFCQSLKNFRFLNFSSIFNFDFFLDFFFLRLAAALSGIIIVVGE
jgi:hypothetical protein